MVKYAAQRHDLALEHRKWGYRRLERSRTGDNEGPPTVVKTHHNASQNVFNRNKHKTQDAEVAERYKVRSLSVAPLYPRSKTPENPTAEPVISRAHLLLSSSWKPNRKRYYG